LCVCMVIGSILVVSLRARTDATNANLAWLLSTIGLYGILQALVFTVIPTDNFVLVLLAILVGATFCVVAINAMAFLARAGQQLIDADRLRLIRRRAFGTSLACLFPGVIIFFLMFTGALPPRFLMFTGALPPRADLMLSSVVLIGLCYPLWRYVGPAAIDIEQLKVEGRLQRPTAQPSARSWWDTPWLALPLVAVFGLTFVIPVVGWWGSLVPFAIPVAVSFAARHGRAALIPIALGTMPLWFALSFGAIRTAGGAWLAAVIILCAKFTADAEFRTRLLQRERLAFSDIVLLALLLFSTVSLDLFGDSKFVTSPGPMLLACCIVLAASRVPIRRTILALLILLALSTALWLWRIQPLQVGAIQLAPGLNPATVVAGLLCIVLVSIYRTTAVKPEPQRATQAQEQTVEATSLLRPDTTIASLVLAYAFLSAPGSLRGFGLPAMSTFTLAAIGFCVGLGIRRSFADRPAISSVLVNIVLVTIQAAVLVLLLSSGIIALLELRIDLNGNQILSMVLRFVVWAGFVAFGHWVRREPQPIVVQPAPAQPETPSSQGIVDALSQRHASLQSRIRSAKGTGRFAEDEQAVLNGELRTLESQVDELLESVLPSDDEMKRLYDIKNSILDLRRDLEQIPGSDPERAESKNPVP
jgi:hypothetical protein